jgi:hypothetical protein
MQSSVLSAIGIPVPGTVPLFAACRQDANGAVIGKRARSGIVESFMPIRRSNLDRKQRATGSIERDELVIDHLGDRMTSHSSALTYLKLLTENYPHVYEELPKLIMHNIVDFFYPVTNRCLAGLHC